MKILKREYDVALSEIKGVNKLGKDQVENTDGCKLTRFVILLDETRYTINEDGNPEMTQAAQQEYDEFIDKIRQEMMRGEIKIIDEGYGTGEDELEWHITAGVLDSDKNEIINGIMEFETCVRTEESDE